MHSRDDVAGSDEDARKESKMDASTDTRQRASLSDYLAAERTFLAWIRTGLALMGFGFVVARFGLFLQQIQVVERRSFSPVLWAIALVRHRTDRSGSGREYSFCMGSRSIGPAVGSGSASAAASVDAGRFNSFVSGFGWTGDGDLPGFGTRLRERKFRKH